MPIHRPGQTVRETPTHVLTLPLDVEPWQAADLGKTIEAARLLYNSLVRYFLKQYDLYLKSRQYQGTKIQGEASAGKYQRKIWSKPHGI